MADGSDTWEKGRRSKGQRNCLCNKSIVSLCITQNYTKMLTNARLILPLSFPALPLSNYGDPGTLLVDGCWLADGSRRRGHRLGTEEEKVLGGACQGRVRGAGARWGRDAEEQGEDERLEEEVREWKRI